MKRLAKLAVVAIAIPVTMLATTAVQSPKAGKLRQPPVPTHCTAQAFETFSASVWRLIRWERGAPPHSTIKAQRRRLKCAPPRHRLVMQRDWQRDKSAYNDHRRMMLWRTRVTPFYGCTPYGCGWFALPVAIVICESSGNYNFPYGAYSILDPAWYAWGGKTAHAGEASKREQDRVAAVGWDLYGEGAWECKSDGSTSWP